MKRIFTALLVMMTALLLVSCATLVGPRQVEVPLYKLQDALDRKFPFNNRYLELLNITVSNPRLVLQPETNRIITNVDTTIAPLFLNHSWKGSIALSGVLQIDASRNAVILANPHVDQFTIPGLDAAYATQLTKVGDILVEEILRDVPLYTFKPSDFRYAGITFYPTKIDTTSYSLVITFEPVK
jgi:hypothetical protein